MAVAFFLPVETAMEKKVCLILESEVQTPF